MYNDNTFSQFGTAHADTSAKALNFGAEVSVDSDFSEYPTFRILEEGDYKFTVRDVAIKDYGGSAKLPVCKYLQCNLIVDGGDAGVASCRYNIYLVNTNATRLRNFLACIGKIGPTDKKFTLSPSLFDIAGLSGRAHFDTREYNGKEYQNFKYALLAEDKEGQALPF